MASAALACNFMRPNSARYADSAANTAGPAVWRDWRVRNPHSRSTYRAQGHADLKGLIGECEFPVCVSRGVRHTADWVRDEVMLCG
jgi:hypothetical protein